VFDHFADPNGEDSPRHREFDKLADGNEVLKERGEAADAIITSVDDLDLPYASKTGRAKHLRFDVTPKNGVLRSAEPTQGCAG
jgi:hypothetical protein